MRAVMVLTAYSSSISFSKRLTCLMASLTAFLASLSALSAAFSAASASPTFFRAATILGSLCTRVIVESSEGDDRRPKKEPLLLCLSVSAKGVREREKMLPLRWGGASCELNKGMTTRG
jgi:hypothetical protein